MKEVPRFVTHFAFPPRKTVSRTLCRLHDWTWNIKIFFFLFFSLVSVYFIWYQENRKWKYKIAETPEHSAYFNSLKSFFLFISAFICVLKGVLLLFYTISSVLRFLFFIFLKWFVLKKLNLFLTLIFLLRIFWAPKFL